MKPFEIARALREVDSQDEHLHEILNKIADHEDPDMWDKVNEEWRILHEMENK